MWRLLLVEAVYYVSCEGDECSDGGVVRFEAMLGLLCLQGVGQEWQQESLKDLDGGHRRLMGLYELPWSLGLPGLGMGMMCEFFHIAGMSEFASEMLKSLVR